ncbi:GGDEF domain-containing protein [Rhizobiaceae bacterium n13]|uniref:diguanylate cyclase n=1 Tax=Ferirhizobium litorale TaxID=2927786 RepID=A0AAE3U0D4_9HYPH|nr:GGDEF domain-containing protein [Fererhizobium litorale]MDI7861074.1 GGDEF domain-containing protein [Fererhizobium litorale]MDI7921221.1 GGDEF domain-containing protein [Fererhizobium litorale]
MQDAPKSAPSAQGRKPAAPTASDVERVAQHMAMLHVDGLPRNYELFHEAICGRNAAVAREIAALGSRPSQIFLDEIGLRHRLVTHCGLAAEKSHAEAARTLRDLALHLSNGVTHKRTLLRALDAAARSLAIDNGRGLADTIAEAEFVSAALTQLLLTETELGRKLEDGLKTLEAVDEGMNDAQQAVLRDRLTSLPNSIAFANHVDALYSAAGQSGSALIVADIDHFRAINEKYGAAAGNKLLKKLAGVFRKSIKKDDFVARIGGDEFAFIFRNVSLQSAHAIAERLRSSVEDNLVYATGDAGDPGRLTVSIGFALTDEAASPEQLQGQAVLALATARANSRTPVVGYTRDLLRVHGKAA